MSHSAPFLLLGGGLYQLPLIQEVRARGLRALVLDGDPQAPGLALGDEGRVVNVSDASAVLEVARAVRPRGVASIVSEASVRSVAAVARELALPGMDPEVALASTDKVIMREKFRRHGLPTPRFGRATSVSDARKLAEEVGFPMVVKPVDSSGSRGVWRVDGVETLGTAVENALQNSASRQVIIESYIEGIECTIEAFTCGGEVHIHGMSVKKRVPFPQCVSIDLTYPTGFDGATERAVADAARGAVAALGIDNAPSHTEVIVSPDGPVVVEAAARGGGYRIFSDIVPWLSGVNAVAAVVDVALGKRPDVRPRLSRAAVLRFFAPAKTGVVRGVANVEQARQMPGVLEVSIDVRPGSRFGGITRDGERPGYVITLGETRADAVSAADLVEETVAFDIEPEQTGAPLAPARP